MLWTEWYYSSYKWRNWSMIQTLEICHGYRPYYQFVHAVLFQRNVGDMWLSNVMLVLMLHVIIWSHVCRGIVITENLWRRILCKNKIHTLQQQVTTTIINNTLTHTKLTTASLTISISNLPFISCGIGCWQPLSVQSVHVEHLWQGRMVDIIHSPRLHHSVLQAPMAFLPCIVYNKWPELV